jgi:hypothetical protein
MEVIQGDADRVLPFDKTGKRLPARHPLDPHR